MRLLSGDTNSNTDCCKEYVTEMNPTRSTDEALRTLLLPALDTRGTHPHHHPRAQPLRSNPSSYCCGTQNTSEMSIFLFYRYAEVLSSFRRKAVVRN